MEERSEVRLVLRTNKRGKYNLMCSTKSCSFVFGVHV